MIRAAFGGNGFKVCAEKQTHYSHVYHRLFSKLVNCIHVACRNQILLLAFDTSERKTSKPIKKIIPSAHTPWEFFSCCILLLNQYAWDCWVYSVNEN